MKAFKNIINCIIKLVAIIIPLATAGAVIYNQVRVRQSVLVFKENVVSVIAQLDTPTENIKNEIIEAIEKVINNDLATSMELLVGLFGIIISVWVGLNIYNVMKKDDYNELLDTITEKCNEHDVIQEKVEDTHSGNMELHISYLYKTFDVNNNSSQYFYSMFKNVGPTNLDYKFLLNATFLETVYVKITTIHEKNEHIKMKPYIEEGFRRCEEMLSWINKNEDKVRDKNKLLGYITYRYGRMYFYQGMMEYYANLNNNKASVNFMDAAKKIEEALEFDDEISRNVDIYNTLGYIYIKVYEWNIDRSEPLYTLDKMQEVITNALKFCKISKHETANSLKNLGIVYERTGDLDTAIQKYRDAIIKDPHDYKSRICLASAYLKKVQCILGIEKNRNILLCDMDFKQEKKKEVLEYVNLAHFELDIASKIDSQSANYYYKLGQLYTYLYLIENVGSEKEKLKSYARQNFQISNSLNPAYYAHRFHERNFYEAIGEISNASKINMDLDGTDVKHLNEIYKKKLETEGFGENEQL